MYDDVVSMMMRGGVWPVRGDAWGVTNEAGKGGGGHPGGARTGGRDRFGDVYYERLVECETK